MFKARTSEATQRPVVPSTRATLGSPLRSIRRIARRDRPSQQPMSLDAATALKRAASEPARALPAALRESLEQRIAHDFRAVRVHRGSGSAEASARFGARAFTVGTDIHLGAEAETLSPGELDRLLVHEAVHTVQQGGRSVATERAHGMSQPGDVAEQEADRIADVVGDGPFSSYPQSRALVARRVSPSIQRQVLTNSPAPPTPQPQEVAGGPTLKGEYRAREGVFDLDLKAVRLGHAVGMYGMIVFKANASAPDSPKIRFLQVGRMVYPATGEVAIWAKPRESLNKMQTVDGKVGVEKGFNVDHNPEAAVRNATTNAVSPYYADYFGSADTYDGSKKGTSVKVASLTDYPHSPENLCFSFETAAIDDSTGHIYATLTWGFTIEDAANARVIAQHAASRDVSTATFDAAVDAFNTFYKNPAPSKNP